jgi:hypothetical protein
MASLLGGAHDLADKAPRTFGTAMTMPDAAGLIWISSSRDAMPGRLPHFDQAGASRIEFACKLPSSDGGGDRETVENANPTNHMRPTAVGAFILPSVIGRLRSPASTSERVCLPATTR